MYLAPVAFIALVFLALVRLTERRLKLHYRPIPLYLRYFTWAYIIIFILMAVAMQQMRDDILEVSSYLDPLVLEELVNGTMSGEELEAWREEASLESYPLLAWFTLMSPVWLIATYVTCLYHTIRHLSQMRSSHAQSYKLHDMTIRILFLPIMYCLMSFQGVVCMCRVIINRVHSDDMNFGKWQQRRDFNQEMYEANFALADIYESYALVLFGDLTIRVLRRQVEGKVELAKKATRIALASRREGATRWNMLVKRSAGQAIQELYCCINDLVAEMRGLTMIGVKLFCWTCVCTASYELIVTTMGYYEHFPQLFAAGYDREQGIHPGFFQEAQTKSKAKFFFLGGGFAASFAAIGNIVQVETQFHHSLQEFSPYLKFWGTKVLVSIAFLQGTVVVAVPPFSHWSEIRQNLFYAALLCLECFFVSILHLVAWGPNEIWYGRQQDDVDQNGPYVMLLPEGTELSAASGGGAAPAAACAASPAASAESPGTGISPSSVQAPLSPVFGRPLRRDFPELKLGPL